MLLKRSQTDIIRHRSKIIIPHCLHKLRHSQSNNSSTYPLTSTQILNKDPKTRITAEEALKHKFFTQNILYSKFHYSSSDEDLIFSLRNLKNFQVYNTLQKSTLSYLASQQLDIATEQHFNSIFLKIDQDHDGQVTEQDLVEGFEKIFHNKTRAANYAKIVMKRTDINKNGVIDYNEFLMANMEYKKALDVAKLKQAFDFYDEDKNGVITIEELKKVFGSICTDEQIMSIMREADANGDEVIDFQEYLLLMQNIRHNGMERVKSLWSFMN